MITTPFSLETAEIGRKWVTFLPARPRKPPDADLRNLPTCPCRAQRKEIQPAYAAPLFDGNRTFRGDLAQDRASAIHYGKRDRLRPDDHRGRCVPVE